MTGIKCDVIKDGVASRNGLPSGIQPALGISRKYIFGLDIARAAAITLVIASHYVHVAEPLGVAGVELFFVLSGYLVGGLFYRLIVIDGARDIGEIFRFLQRRWARTIPNYLLFLIIWMSVFPPLLGLKSVLPWLVFSQNLYHSQTVEFFGVAWSLSVEEWFYVIVPVAIFVATAIFGRPLVSTIFVILLTIVTCFSLRYLATVTDANSQIRTVVIYRLDALALGVAAAVVADQWPSRWLACSRLWFVALSLLLILSFALMEFKATISGPQASLLFLAFPICSVILLAKLVTLQERAGGLSGVFAKSVKKISHWTYSLYLVHMLVYLKMVDTQTYINAGFLGKVSFKVGAVALTILLSAIIYRRFEQPMLRLFSPKTYRAL